jgi:PPOX class probable F420-dependent enzyme
MDLAYPVMNRGRHRKASLAAREPAGAGDFEALRGRRQALVVTYRRSGEPVPTPVNHGLSQDGRLYFRSEPDAWKIKRIAHTPRVLVIPCNLRGKPLGPGCEATARILDGAEREAAERLVNANWSTSMRVAERTLDRLGVPEAYVEVTAVAPSAG